MIEHLPAELRDRFTEMREQDLSVQSKFNSLYIFNEFDRRDENISYRIYSLTYLYFLTVDRVDSLEDRQKTFFTNCSKNKLKGSEKDEYESIRKEYQKVIFLSLLSVMVETIQEVFK